MAERELEELEISRRISASPEAVYNRNGNDSDEILQKAR